MIEQSAMLCPVRGCGRAAAAPCGHCAEFLAACAHHAPNGGPVYGGRALLELVAQAVRSIGCGRTAEGAATLHGILQAAGMVPAEDPRIPPARRGDVQPAPPGPSAA